MRMGASHALGPEKVDMNEAILELTMGRGADYVVECAGYADKTLEPLEACLAVNATLIDIGMGGTRPPVADRHLQAARRSAGRSIRACRQGCLSECDSAHGCRAHRHATDDQRTYASGRSAGGFQATREPRGRQDNPVAGQLMEPDPILFHRRLPVFWRSPFWAALTHSGCGNCSVGSAPGAYENPEQPENWNRVALRYAVGCFAMGSPVHRGKRAADWPGLRER